MARLLPSPDSMKKDSKTHDHQNTGRHFTTVKGILVPAGWDEKGRVISVAISTRDENEYLVEGDEKGKSLLPLVREEVEITGTVTGNRGCESIIVDQYRRTSGSKPTD